MKKIRIKKIFLTFFAGIISVVFFYGCAGTGIKLDETEIKIKGRKEILVASKYDRGGDSFFTLKWCGNTGLIFRSEKLGVGLIDMKTGEKTVLNLTLSDTLMNCTSDGKGLFYMDDVSKRDDEEPAKKTDIELAPGIHLWSSVSIIDMYLYDIETHKKILVASMRDVTGNDVLSPDEKKILLGIRHKLASRKGVLDEWETVWFARDKDQGNAIWFPDSSGVVSYGTGYANIMCVEFFGKDGWDRCFKQEGNMLELKMDKEGGIYYQEGHPLDLELFLRQCVIKDRNVICKRMLEQYNVFRNFDFLPGGDILFEDYENDVCVHRSTPDGKVTECVIGVRFNDHIYDSVSVIGVSPDGRRLAFRRSNKTMKPGRKKPYWEGDLFVIELENN